MHEIAAVSPRSAETFEAFAVEKVERVPQRIAGLCAVDDRREVEDRDREHRPTLASGLALPRGAGRVDSVASMGVGSVEGSLESVDGGAYRLGELLRGQQRVLLLFAHSECPTSRLALERLGPLGPALAGQGVRFVCVVQEPLETTARLSSQHGVASLVLAERPP